MSFKKNVNPNTLYKGTTWARIKGRCIVGLDESDNDLKTVGATGGEKTHTLTQDEMPGHRHSGAFGYDSSYISNIGLAGPGGTQFNLLTVGVTEAEAKKHGFVPPKIGKDMAHNNMQPYIVAYMWERIS